MRIASVILSVALAAMPMPLLAAPEAASAATTPTPVEPARLKAARPVVDRLFPVGTYKRLMGGTMDKMMNSLMDGVLAMPMRDIAAIGGLDEERLAAMDKTSIAEIMAIYDPHYRERMQRGTRAMMDSMVGLMTEFEPRVRDGLTRAYARKFTAAQLDELAGFFATPTGSLYASESMAIFMDPEIMGEMQAWAPEMAKKIPDMAKEAEKATAALPRPRKIEELSPAERARLAKLLGVKPDELREPAEALKEDVVEE